MPATALAHFQQDIVRARAIVAHAAAMPSGTPNEKTLRCDILRSGWMFGVGAFDAYFCDAYTDIVAATIISKNRHAAIAPPGFGIPEFFLKIKFPVRAILEPYDNNTNWRWRMGAREMMLKENVLTLETIQQLFNKFFRPKHRFFGDLLPAWILHQGATRRVFGITKRRFNALAPDVKTAALQDALERLEDRFKAIIQRRHDCIHNCDRPRVSPQAISVEPVTRAIDDVEFFVLRCNEHINSEYRQFLIERGCPNQIVLQAGY